MDDDEAAFVRFVTARWPALVQSAYLITVDRGIAEDCVQEALARVHRRWGRIEQDNPEPYVRKAVINAALSWRVRRRIREVPLDAAPVPVVEFRSEQLGDFDHRLMNALRSLPPLMRAAVVLRYLEDRSEGETAHLLGCSPGTVKSASSRGVAKLRAAMLDTSVEGVKR
ncbi:DNA-directed RNA polymerase sigma-70 factor [Kineosporia sp. NBRC 101677]|uniref:SigE family RNA polymerase sigma factor n=1 Tax=Kineosporia sp. NBRC 101677 TaxID=3032197 RepID=UPI0024A4BD8A|nr:SigE family RNA polymerase sigma factor [Kineosporia sp. NBRC 101677]GLY14978.1 DNA-directed RNA polymerase sigma-70 factor [Kineosporia sp. NBRC 101677]